MLKRSFLILLLVLPGCGFQLRGTELGGLGSVRLTGAAAAPATYRALREALRARGIETASPDEGAWTIALIEEESSRRTVATTNVIDAAAYEIRLELLVAITRRDELQGDEALVYAERVYEVDRANLSGSFEQQTLLMDEMREEISDKLIRRLEAVSQAGQQP